MSNQRRHPRIPMGVKVKIFHPERGEIMVKTRNISDSGLFLFIDPDDIPPLGTVLFGQVQGMLEDPPLVKMKVVRLEAGGVGLQFMEGEEDADVGAKKADE